MKESGKKPLAVANGRRYARKVRYDLLCAWYGEAFAATEMAAHTQSASELSEVMSELLKKTLTGELYLRMEIERRWPELSGALLGKFGKVVSLEEKVLTVEVRHPALLLECRDMTDLIRDKINLDFGANACTEVRFVPSGRLGGRSK
ncbi:MAG: DciA family protein [Victivallaceae bacterium]|nr:DciA family protein [Victivallaceae bacterium]